MNVVEINKYRPSIFRRGRFLTEDWTSVSQIGEEWNGKSLTATDYLAVEDRYVRAARRFMAAAAVDALEIRGLESWREPEPHLRAVGLDLEDRPPPRDGDHLAGDELDDFLRRCLRELAWGELVRPQDFLIHPGYDLRLVIATTAETGDAEAATRQDGLYAYPGSGELATLEAWAVVRPG